MESVKYTHREIEKITFEGSVKQKARLFLRDRMGYFGLGFIMTYDEVDRLSLSVRDTLELREWNEYISFGLRLENGFKDLQRSVARFENDRDDLLRTLNEIQDFERLEETINILSVPNDPVLWEDSGEWDSLIPDICLNNLRDRHLPDGVRFNLINPTLDSQNLYKFNLTGEGSLMEQAQEEKDILENEMTIYLAMESAMRKRISEARIRVPEYEERLSLNRAVIDKPLTLCPRFMGVQDNRSFYFKEVGEIDKVNIPNPALRDLIENYDVRVESIDMTDENIIDEINKTYEQI